MTVSTVRKITATWTPPPNRGTDTNTEFRLKADAWVASAEPITDQTNDTVDDINAAGDDIDAAVASTAADVITVTDLKTDVNTLKGQAATSASNAATSEANAETAASVAVASANTAAGYKATSPTNLTIGMGAKSLFLAQTGKLFASGDFVQISDAADPNNFMSALVQTHNDTTGAMTVDVRGIGGSGAKTSWKVAISGQTGGAATSGTLSGVLNFAPTATIASAGTTDIGGAASNNVSITGTTTITALGTAPEGATRNITFTGALTLTHNAVSLIIPGAANIVTAAGDTAVAQSLGSGNWRITSYTKADGTAGTLKIPYLAKTAAYTVALGDRGALVDCTTGSFTVAYPSAGTAGAGWYGYLRNSGPGLITGPTVDGAVIVLGPGDAVLLQSDGTSYHGLWLRKGGWQLVATSTVGSTVSTITFSSIPNHYTDVNLVVDGLTSNAGEFLAVSVSDLTGWSSPVNIRATPESFWSGEVRVEGIRQGVATVRPTLTTSTLGATPDAKAATGTSFNLIVRASPALTGVRLSCGGADFSAGAVKLYGRP